MRWLTHLCSVTSFKAWPQFETEASSVLSDVDTLLPEARDVLSFYLRSPSSFNWINDDDDDDDTITSISDDSNYHSSTSTGCISARYLPHASTLEAAEILLAALTDSPWSQQQVVRSPIVPSELGLCHLPSFGAPRNITAVVPSLAVYTTKNIDCHDINDGRGGTKREKATVKLSSPTSPEPNISSPTSATISNTLPLVSVMSVQPATPLLPESTKASSPHAVAAALSDCFADARLADPALKELVSVRAVMCSMTQAITAALLSQSGIAALTNGTHALALRVDRIEDVSSRRASKLGSVTRRRGEISKDTNQCNSNEKRDSLSSRSKTSNRGHKRDYSRRRVVVRVSRIFEMDWRSINRAGPAHAVVAAVRAGIKSIKNDPRRASYVRECVLRVGSVRPDVFFDDGPPWTFFSSSALLSSTFSSSSTSTTSCSGTGNIINLNVSICSCKDLQLCNIEPVYYDGDNAMSLIDMVIQNHRGVLAFGTSSTVLRSSILFKRSVASDNCKEHCNMNVGKFWNERGVDTTKENGIDVLKVAVKKWNDIQIDGLRDLLGEISIFRSLHIRAPHLIGVAVPRLIAWRTSPPRDATLVTELVGKAVQRVNNALLVGDNDEEHGMERVVGADARALIDAARRSLRLLHEVGVAHGDVTLNSLRVQRDSTRTGGWRAWWVDLAHAFDDIDAPDFDTCRFEIERVEKLLTSSDT